MSEKLFPERKQCKTCRKKFKEIVLVGLYCSYPCGNFPAPAQNIADAPRSCKREVDNQWGYKTRFKSSSEVPEKYRNDPSTNIYACENCRFFHIGHSRPDATTVPREKLVRYVKSFEELGTVVSRYMDSRNIDKKKLAQKMKVPAIRITEVHNGSPKVSAMFLFKLLNELHLRIEITSPK